MHRSHLFPLPFPPSGLCLKVVPLLLPTGSSTRKVLHRCGRTFGHFMVGEFTVTEVPLFLFAFLVSSCKMDGKAERRWLGTSPCDNERTIASRKNALRAYEGKSSELISPGPRSRVGTEGCCVGPAWRGRAAAVGRLALGRAVGPRGTQKLT